MSDVIYPFDPTGSSPANKVTGEEQVVTAANYQDYHFIIPNAAPYYESSMVITAKAPNGDDIEMVKYRDWYPAHWFLSASRATAEPIYGSVMFAYTDFAGVIKMEYQTVGGNWTLNESKINEILSDNIHNPRITAWEQVANYPAKFPVIDHEWDLDDVVGASEIVEMLDNIRDAILENSGSGLPAHLADKNNPHEVTKTQVGLGLVENYPPATQVQAEAGTNNVSVMTPLRTAQLVAIQVPLAMQSHVNNTSNPHNVTKSQVGLSAVNNYATATNAETVSGTASNLYTTPAGVRAAILGLIAPLTDHLGNTGNPHNTTKEQVGLNNVQNYGIATLAEAQAGTATDKYMTPVRVAQYVAVALTNAGFSTHLTDTSNPHNTTKGQVGLGQVENYPIASLANTQDENNTTSYITPQRLAQGIDFYIGDDFQAHLNATNPHGITKSTIGLSNVQNYTMANDAEAEAGSASDRYMSPRAVKLAITAQASGAIGTHTSDTNNPHQVTKTQVGLGLVDNYATADNAASILGTAANLFMTPAGTKAAITAGLNVHVSDTGNPHQVTKAQVGLSNVVNNTTVNDAAGVTAGSGTAWTTAQAVKQYVTDGVQASLTAHAALTNNPHGVTKAQVGLSAVENFPIATQLEAETGTAADRYLTPQRGAQLVAPRIQVAIDNFAARRDNPNQVTAAQVGAPTTTAMNNALSGKLDTTGIAADSSHLAGLTLAQVLEQAASGAGADLTALRAEIKAATADALRIPSHNAIPGNPTGNIWLKLGVLKIDPATAQDQLTNIKSDLHWMVAGGELPSAEHGEMTYLHVSIHGVTNANGHPVYAVARPMTEAPTLADRFYYVWDNANTELTVWMRGMNGMNPVTVTNLNKAGAVLETAAVQTANPAGIFEFTLKASAANADMLSGLTKEAFASAIALANLTDVVNTLRNDFEAYKIYVAEQLQDLADQINGTP